MLTFGNVGGNQDELCFDYRRDRFINLRDIAMIDPSEFSCQPVNETQFNKSGTVNIHTSDLNERKPTWLVILKVVGLLAMLPIGFAIVVQLLPLPPLQASAVTSGVLLIYIGLAYFIRPEANVDNLGWMGGGMDDKFQYNDDMNRMLYSAHCWLAPGRFAAQAIIDLMTLCGIIPEVTAAEVAAEQSSKAESQRQAREQEIKARVAARQASEQHGGSLGLSSTRYLNPERFAE